MEAAPRPAERLPESFALTPTLEAIISTVAPRTTAEARIPTLEEAKESGVALVLPPIVEPESLGMEAHEQTRAEVDPTTFAWSLEPSPSETVETETDRFIDRITIQEVLAVSGLLSDEEHETAELLPVAPTFPFALPEIPFRVLAHEASAEPEPLTPEQTFEQFAEAMAALAKPVVEEKGASHAGTAETSPPIVATVSERLATLEPEQKEAVLPIVQELTEAIAEVRVLQTALATPVELTEAKQRVHELSTALLEAIGIEYDEESLQQFIQSLLHPDFLPQPTKTAEELDLERMGTHEVKRHFPQFFTTLADLFADMPVGYLLGRFALFCESFTSDWPERGQLSRAESGSVAA